MSNHECINRLMGIEISYDDAIALRRIAMTLHCWHELECGVGNDYASWCISRGRKENGEFIYDDNGDSYEERHVYSENKARYTRIPDRERGALKQLAKIMKRYPRLISYIQTDPRGAPLYIIPWFRVPESAGHKPAELYSRYGIAVHK